MAGSNKRDRSSRFRTRSTPSGQNPELVYLDLNKWSDLAHAAAGTLKGERYQSALTVITRMVGEGRILCPLSAAHLMEVAKIGNQTQRNLLARLMTQLSRGWFLASAGVLLMPAMRRAIARQFQIAADLPPVEPLTRSLTAALADAYEVALPNAGDDQMFQSPVVLETFISTARVGVPFLSNWTRFAEGHERARSLVSDEPRHVRKRAYCVCLTLGIRDRLAAAFADFGMSMNVLQDIGPDRCVALLESVPFLDVELNLHLERNSQLDREIDPNDEIDLGFLSLAIPYCHTVVTEKFWVSLVRRLGLDQKYATHITHDLCEVALDLQECSDDHK